MVKSEVLEFYYDKFNRPEFIADDPVSIPHLFTRKEDIEIAGFLAATISWGNRMSILKNGRQLMRMMGDAPYEFVVNHGKKDLAALKPFVHRTFNGTDLDFFIRSLKNIYVKHGGLEKAFNQLPGLPLGENISQFRQLFLLTKHEGRSEKHLSDPSRNSSAKRLCMFLRWMVRHDNRGVDFGIWRSIRTSSLMLPLDVHTGTVSRQLGLLQRKQNDWKAVEEVTAALRSFDPRDPVRFDFALFGLGVNRELDQL